MQSVAIIQVRICTLSASPPQIRLPFLDGLSPLLLARNRPARVSRSGPVHEWTVWDPPETIRDSEWTPPRDVYACAPMQAPLRRPDESRHFSCPTRPTFDVSSCRVHLALALAALASFSTSSSPAKSLSSLTSAHPMPRRCSERLQSVICAQPSLRARPSLYGTCQSTAGAPREGEYCGEA